MGLPQAEYVEVGWGDRDFYRTSTPTMGIKLKALLWPTASVLHIVVFDDPVQVFFSSSEIVELRLSYPAFTQLIAYIAASYAMDESDRAIALGPGLYGDSAFFLSREIYHAFNTCNVWTARALRVAGYPITPFFTLTVGRLFSQVHDFGQRVQHDSTE